MTTIANIVICYNNESEIEKYIDQLETQISREHISLVIVVNKSRYSQNELEELFFSSVIDTIVLFPDCNLGYLNGLTFGYRYLDQTIKDDLRWVVFSNTDIVFHDNKFFSHLLINEYSEEIWMIGPSIFNNGTDINMNPYIKQRYSRHKLYLLILCYKFAFMSKLLEFFNKKKKANFPTEVSSPCFTYGIHGSFMILKPELAQTANNYPWELLYAEENCLAEICLLNQKKVYFDPYIEVSHMAGSVTGTINNTFRNKLHIKALRLLLKYFY